MANCGGENCKGRERNNYKELDDAIMVRGRATYALRLWHGLQLCSSFFSKMSMEEV